MTTSASGSVVDENGAGLPGLGVFLEDVSRVLVVSLAKTTTNNAGQFSLTYADDLTVSNEPGKQVRQLRLRIQVGQHVLKEMVQADSTQSTLTFPTIQLKAAEASNWWATLGTGAPARVTHGNALRWLVDNEDAWARVEDVIEHATTLDVMQLQIDVDEYASNIHSEKPRIVLRFNPQAPLTAATRRAMDDADQRIERSLLSAVQRGVDVRIQIPKMRVDRHGLTTIGAIAGIGALIVLGGTIAGLIAIIAGAVIAVLGIATIAALLYVERQVFSDQFGKRKLARWFERAIADIQSHPPVGSPLPALGTVRVGELRMRSNVVTHAKMVIDRGTEAVLLGSPFEQVYFDSQHALDEPRRGGDAGKGPIHDVSVAVRGPAVGHLQEVFNSHWNVAEPADPLPATPVLPAAPTSTNSGEFTCSVQVVRTLDYLFATATDGEKGILEAYLRAIHFAERFIYIENQYFNDDAITQALIDALAAKPALRVILLLNAGPDMPLYLGWQQHAIRRIAASIGDAATAAKRFGVFSAWTHASANQTGGTKPTLVDNYLHTKTALVDNRWATVGSANLDGASLDFLQYARAMLDGEVRNTETNLVVFEETGAPSAAVDALRRRLWSEHLGFSNPADSALNDAPDKDWLAVWSQRAASKRDALTQNLDSVSPIRVLAWPAAAFEESVKLRDRHQQHTTAKKYLQYLLSPDDVASDVLVSQFEVLGKQGPPSFEFHYDAAAASGTGGPAPRS